ncbi:heparinase II/III family protein [uncultured Arcticibacterium sp.]|uniref:heparinase II/III family protein n=1 Tax=uncultured Arcticibacterium sp. TaxID=2173042 RepID=UPI0030F6D264
MRLLLFVLISLFLKQAALAQFVFPQTIERNHPRLISPKVSKETIRKKLESSQEVREDYEAIKSKISKYVVQFKSDPEWLSSRLQMHWKTHATEVYVDGVFYSHSEGTAPVPTVRFTGQRDYVTDYKMPSFEEMKPYLEDERGLYLQHKETGEWAWIDVTKTGRIIENTNERILRVARNASLVYYIEGDEDYAKLAAHLFDVYMQGLYYRNEPIDLKKQVQHVIGLTSFQVIKENIVDELAETYDFLYDYLKKNKKEQVPVYTASLKKLAEIIIKNGVPDNNWNLHQANYVIQIALVLDDDNAYADGKGCQYYLNRVFNESEARQWSVKDVLASGYDQENGVWNESAGYALSVAKGYSHLVKTIQEALNINILPDMPILPKAVAIMPQYLYPNKSIVAFGDSHYGPLETEVFLDLVSNAQQFKNREQEEEFTSLIYMLEGKGEKHGFRKNAFNEFLYNTKVELDHSILPANPDDYITSTFYAPNVSWVAMRNGFDRKHGLMVSQFGSLGNHAHSNGIAMELYGKGFILGPEGGRGSSYLQADYREYYSQFPAHNTVSVNGKSQYNKMRSYYAFEVNSLYPASERKTGFYPNINFSDLYFNEPSTNADQNRVMSIIRTGETTGYYVDIFRSKQKDGADKYHDYFYHNLGQKLAFTTIGNQNIVLEPSSKLTSKAGNIKAYDYLKDEHSAKIEKPFKARYSLKLKGQEEVNMNIWVQGNENREVFKVSTPPSEAFRHKVIPDEIVKDSLLTTVVRQYGEAWTKPFVTVYEPSSETEPASIKSIESFKSGDNESSFVGLKIESLANRTDYIFSSDHHNAYEFGGISFEGTYTVVSTENETSTLFLGAGKSISKDGYSIEILGKKSGSAALVTGKKMMLSCDDAILLTFPDTLSEGKPELNIGLKVLYGKRVVKDGKSSLIFKVPSTEYQEITLGIK